MNPLMIPMKIKQNNEIKKTVQNVKVEIETAKKTKSEGKWK